jgi:hypothetical protein
MRRLITTSPIVLGLVLCGQVIGGEGKTPEAPLLQTPHPFHPAGGWHPYGGGLFHWWDPRCFPCQAAADDYCRKPLPKLCWPSYPRYYTWGPPQVIYPGVDGFPDSPKPR